ncbi:MAG: nuclear transport factor 2 family protein [Pseudomonadota bacterium]
MAIRSICVAAAAMLYFSGVPAAAQEDIEARNKGIAQKFYDDLWFSNNTDRYVDYVAETYVVHDIGDRKNITEPAIEQKQIADFFWSIGTLEGEMDYQIAEGDMVANRWTITFTPNAKGEEMGMGAVEDIPIINAFRFNDDGKIVEIWNHRHDVDLPRPKGPPPVQ